MRHLRVRAKEQRGVVLAKVSRHIEIGTLFSPLIFFIEIYMYTLKTFARRAPCVVVDR